jgi:alpha-tubulin suppressor-like RCC1 family protein
LQYFPHFRKLDFFNDYMVQEVALGSSVVHVLAKSKATNEVKVFAWGANNFGQLLQGDDFEKVLAQPYDISAEFDEEIKQISSGGFHTLFLSASGKVQGLGRSNQGQLGCLKADRTQVLLDIHVDYFDDQFVRQLQAGSMFSMALIANKK